MTVLQFFNTIKRFAYTKDCIHVINDPINIKYFFIDFNSLIHTSKNDILKNLNNQFEKKISIDNNFNEAKINNIKIELEKQINHLIQDSTMKYVSNIIKTAIVKLDTIYIAIDGVPSIAKMIEQKKRRFMGKLMEIIELKLVEKYKQELSSQKTKMGFPNRYLFEKYKIRWTSSHISPGTKFMIDFSKNLKSADYINQFINPRKYIFSNFTSVGEGEKKILNYIIDKYPSEDVMIYSPDADVILLSMLLPNKNVYVIRHDDRTGKLLSVDINSLRRKLYDLFKLYYKGSKVNKIENYIRDLILLLTFFGDDFVPKIESYGVKFHLIDLISAYTKGFDKHGNLTNNQIINNKCLISILFELTQNSKEKIILVEKYLNDYYKSYGFIRQKFTEWCIKKNINSSTILFPNIFKKCIEMYNYINKKFSLDKSQLITHIEKLDKKNKLIIDILYNVFFDYTGEGVSGLINIIKRGQKLPYMNLPIRKNNLVEYVRMESKGKPYNLLPLKIQQIQNKSTFDIMFFGIEKMIDIREHIPGINWNSYFEKSSRDLYQLGYVDIPSHENNYKFNTNKYADKMITIFKKYQFGNKDVIKQYLDGIMWTYNYYNTNDLGMNSWFYDFRKAPLLTDIYNYLKKGYDINKGSDTYKKTTVTNNYFTPYEQIAFITPMEDINTLPDNVITIFKKSNKFMKYIKEKNPDLEKLAKQIINYKKPSPLNCKDEMFFNRCTIKGSEDIKDEIQKIVKTLDLQNVDMNTSKFDEVCELL